MRHITDSMIDAVLRPEDAQLVLREAFEQFGRGQAAMQARERTEAGGIKLSTLGAVIPGQGVAGAKVYTTLQGRFTFVILIFSTTDGRPLASMDALAITRLRTAACSVIAARHLARPDCQTLALFGAGTQGTAHAEQMAAAYGLREIRICDHHPTAEAAQRLALRCHTQVRLCDCADEALDGADLVVTASRATEPLFDGDKLPPGCFVAAIGSSLPHTRELDDRALARASRIAVEWKPQSLHEAGDLILAAPGLVTDGKLVELGALVSGQAPGRQHDDEITIYKSVGVGLEDIALAGLAYRRLSAASADC
ncbi:ornithine cyclodeaminase family protein [Ideonella sp. B7]|uniref:ornithine cyclodeaminase family protein n=1 Tax=Ideonella benzenivorans TaxID=2831643 RepID=UPI001CECB450|nr:ornithine cyclodeaminase family protein [Ideonella benzenivorans]MCA6217139.1 ornithine cyclodeaminase family protein [Ideonella benzenivorans]